MPLVRRGTPTRSASAPVALSLADLNAVDPEVRRHAARVLASKPNAVEPLGEALGSERDPTVREAILTALVQIGGPAAVEALLPYLRSDDAALRTGALDAVQNLPASLDRLPMLLDDPDPDLRILAAEVARAMPAAAGARLLCQRLAREEDPNVCAAALDVLAEVGGPDCLPILRACAERFAAEPFVSYAVGMVIARIAGSPAPGSR